VSEKERGEQISAPAVLPLDLRDPQAIPIYVADRKKEMEARKGIGGYA
jgi:hypothetical protein